jgi:oxalate decarboxylase/phosphoglucose isomerase-like protein (cupin superfamily)
VNPQPVVPTPTVEFERGRPRLGRGFAAEHYGHRTYAELSAVAAVPPGRAGRRVQYWTFADVADAEHTSHLRALPVSYDITVLSARPMAWERPKTQGHVHTSRDVAGVGFPELYEVLDGHAGFLVQDLLPGPGATFCALIDATEGETVVIPPLLHHITINLGEAPLVVADVVCRASDDDYRGLRAAHGMANYLRTDGAAIPNPSYRAAPSVERVSAAGWAAAPFSPLFDGLSASAGPPGWLCDGSRFVDVYPELWGRVSRSLRDRSQAPAARRRAGDPVG